MHTVNGHKMVLLIDGVISRCTRLCVPLYTGDVLQRVHCTRERIRMEAIHLEQGSSAIISGKKPRTPHAAGKRMRRRYGLGRAPTEAVNHPPLCRLLLPLRTIAW